MITLLAALVLLALAMLMLSIGLLLGRKGGFPSTHVGSNQAMRERGISCHTSQQRDMQRKKGLWERMASRNA